MSAFADRRLPRPTPLTQPWWDACAEGRLLIQHCASCGHYQFYPRTSCSSCHGEQPDWFEATGKGRVISFTVIRHPVSKAYADEVPYPIVLIELNEGPVMMSTLADCDAETVSIGLEVEVDFEQWTESVTMPKFRPA